MIRIVLGLAVLIATTRGSAAGEVPVKTFFTGNDAARWPAPGPAN